MSVLTPYDLKAEGTLLTQSDGPFPAARVVSMTLVLTQDDIQDPTKAISQTVVEQSTDGGVTWTPFASTGPWKGGPGNAPKNAGDPWPSPGVSGVQVAQDGRTRHFRARIDLPKSMKVGVSLDVT